MPTPTIVAHRGFHYELRENTLESMLAAWNARIDWCECDVRGSIEHEPFLMHDETLERTYGRAGIVRETAAKILDDLKVPRLDAVIEAMPSHARFLIEIKPKVHEEVVRRTLGLCNVETCIVQSFDAQILWQAATIRPAIPLALLVDDAKSVAAREEGPWRAINANFKSLDRIVVGELRERRLDVGAWTVNSSPDIRRMLDLGIDTIISDDPKLAARLAEPYRIG